MSKISTFSERLNDFLLREQITKSDLSRRAEVDKSSITHYTKGDWEAKQDVVYRIAKAFNLNEAWLMGYDVPMYKLAFPESVMPEDLLLCLPFIATISEFCNRHQLDSSPILHYYQEPQNKESLINLLTYGTPKLNDRIYFEKYIGCSIENAIKSVRDLPESYLPLILSRAEINTIIAIRSSSNLPE